MGKNLVRQDFLSDSTWTAPAGVTSVRVITSVFSFSQLGGGAVGGATSSTYLTSAGDAVAAGVNANGQIGDGTVTPRSSPVLVIGGFKWRQLSSGGGNVLALTVAGDAYGWGRNSNGEIGNTSVTPASSPVIVFGGNLKWRQLSASLGSSAGITRDATAYCWGLNSSGQLGDGTLVAKSTPTLVVGGQKWRQISIGVSTTIAIDSNGDAYGWGDNSVGAIGDGTIVGKSSPVLVSGGKKWVQVFSSNGSSYGIDINGDAYGWGVNTNGQLGIGSVLNRSTPTLILGSLKWKQLSCGSGSGVHTVGVTRDGLAYAWGYNASGGLGDGSVVPKSSPVLVLGGFKWIRATANGDSTLGVETSSTSMYAWGANANGQLGLGDVTPRSSPVVVLGGFGPSTVYIAIANEVILPVVPNTVYDVKTFGLTAYFDYHGVYQDPYFNGALPIKITLEYEA